MKWLNQAKSFPVAFSQVREDPQHDLQLVQRIGKNAKILMIASGGCTAAHLVAHAPFKQLELIDPNSAQLCLAQAKIQSLKQEPKERQALFTQAKQTATQTFFDQEQLDLALLHSDHCSLNQCGRYEQLFAAFRQDLQQRFRADLPRGTSLSHYLTLHPETIKNKLHQSFQHLFRIEHLIDLFGAGACHNPLKTFAQHFYDQCMLCIRSGKAVGNYFVEDLFDGHYQQQPAWLCCPAQKIPEQILYTQAMMLERLIGAESSSIDLIHLSNILDWLDVDHAQKILAETQRVLKPNGYTILRQLNSNLEITPLLSPLHLDHNLSTTFQVNDRSFFYRRIFVAKKC